MRLVVGRHVARKRRAWRCRLSVRLRGAGHSRHGDLRHGRDSSAPPPRASQQQQGPLSHDLHGVRTQQRQPEVSANQRTHLKLFGGALQGRVPCVPPEHCWARGGDVQQGEPPGAWVLVHGRRLRTRISSLSSPRNSPLGTPRSVWPKGTRLQPFAPCTCGKAAAEHSTLAG
jgi:hypothetical protein